MYRYSNNWCKKFKVFWSKESVAEGFDGILCLNLNQAKLHEIFSIDHNEYKKIKNIVNEYERNKNKSFIVMVKKGIFLSPPTIIIYKNIISKYENKINKKLIILGSYGVGMIAASIAENFYNFEIKGF